MNDRDCVFSHANELLCSSVFFSSEFEEVMNSILFSVAGFAPSTDFMCVCVCMGAVYLAYKKLHFCSCIMSISSLTYFFCNGFCLSLWSNHRVWLRISHSIWKKITNKCTQMQTKNKRTFIRSMILSRNIFYVCLLSQFEKADWLLWIDFDFRRKKKWNEMFSGKKIKSLNMACLKYKTHQA